MDTANLPPFGPNLVAMVTPMRPDGSLDRSSLERLVDHLVSGGCDGLVVAGTTGEAPTLTDAETMQVIRHVVDQVAGAVPIIAGIGTYDTAATITRARAAEGAGASGLLLVCPYYSRPTQAGVVAHVLAVAESSRLPIMLYDVPARTGTAFTEETLVRLGDHPRIVAVKDAKGDLFEAMSVMERTTLAYYCGIDELNLPYLAAGAAGLVSVVANVVPERITRLIAEVGRGDLASARRTSADLHAMTEAIMRTSSGAIMAKAALAELGIIASPGVRSPLVTSPAEDLVRLRTAMTGLVATPV